MNQPTDRQDGDGLLPCPFCGSNNLKSGSGGGVVLVWCVAYQATGPDQYSKTDWNTRATFSTTRDGAEGALLVPDEKTAERMTADRMQETAAPPKPAPDAIALLKYLDIFLQPNPKVDLSGLVCKHGLAIEACPSRKCSNPMAYETAIKRTRDYIAALSSGAGAAEPDDQDPPMKWLIESLRNLARDLLADPKTPWIGERDPKQHICWIAANRLATPPVRGEWEAP